MSEEHVNRDLMFDQACEDIEPADIGNGENCIEWIRGQKTVTVQLAGHSRYANRVKQYASDFPDEVKICGENRDGSIVAHLPLRYIKITRPAKRSLSDEQRRTLGERLAGSRNKNHD